MAFGVEGLCQDGSRSGEAPRSVRDRALSPKLGEYQLCPRQKVASNFAFQRRAYGDLLVMGGLIHDIAAMGSDDWQHLIGLLLLLAVTYEIGMQAGYAKARNGGFGWYGFAFLAFWIVVCGIANHSGTPIPPWWSSVPGYGD
jgi:hypothetical protein